MNATHQASSFAVEVGVHFLFEGRLVKIATADSNAQGDGFLLSLSGHILVHSYRRVDTTPLAEEGADSAS